MGLFSRTTSQTNSRPSTTSPAPPRLSGGGAAARALFTSRHPPLPTPATRSVSDASVPSHASSRPQEPDPTIAVVDTAASTPATPSASILNGAVGGGDGNGNGSGLGLGSAGGSLGTSPATTPGTGGGGGGGGGGGPGSSPRPGFFDRLITSNMTFMNQRNRTPRGLNEFYIELREPHKTFNPGDMVRGTVHMTVARPLRITHITVGLHGSVRTGAPAESNGPVLRPMGLSKRVVYHGNGQASIFQDEVVLSREGCLEIMMYEFQFELKFPTQIHLPSSISVSLCIHDPRISC